MSRSLRPLDRARIILIAVVNAGLTWTILIIAPLGLFAVLTCTFLVFLSSLIAPEVVERILLPLLFGSKPDGLGSPPSIGGLQPPVSPPIDPINPDWPSSQLPSPSEGSQFPKDLGNQQLPPS
ncbi:MAG: hypothetical protein HC924_19475 [Synechococcaceae cyanobacterium SM2_3_2]|nr:hypothetical protein [Synechococcaceae cyanobacterium SM2_3_2]